MGVHCAVAHDKFPKQGSYLHAAVEVVFNYDTAQPLRGTLVRDDAEDPWRTIIRLEDGRYVLGTECQYRLPGEGCR